MQCRSLDSSFAVPSYQTGTLFEIRNDNLQVTVIGNPPYTKNYLQIQLTNVVKQGIFV